MSTAPAFESLITMPQLGQFLLSAPRLEPEPHFPLGTTSGGNQRQAAAQLVRGNRTGTAARRTNRRRAEQLR